MTDEQREQLLDNWDSASGGWARQAERTREWLAPLSNWMLDKSELAPGVRVVELAAGPGDLSLLAAPRVAPTKVLCSDAVESMVDAARERAKEHGVENVEFGRLQLEWIDLPAASVDVIMCRFGLMFAVDPAAALRECRRVLAPGGRLVLGVWDVPGVNAAFSLLRDAAAALELLGETEGPGAFALSEPGLLRRLHEEAGFLELDVAEVAVPERYESVVDWIGTVVDRSASFGAMWRQLDDMQRAQVREEIRRRAEPYLQSDGSVAAPMRALASVATV
ncbi:MAG: methyltransferase domain-containing protein [Solirubrobacterales bacterium]|nr:methyltransferase domain-containing protein [Solirubrobacterales bacterium]